MNRIAAAQVNRHGSCALLAALWVVAGLALGAGAGQGEVDLRWDANREADLAGYRVYRGEADGTSRTLVSGDALTTATTWRDTGLELTTRTYWVSAVDTSDNESALAGPVVAMPVDVTPPVLPGGLRIESIERSPLAWLLRVSTPGAEALEIRLALSRRED